MKRKIILASGSPRRKELLMQIGMEPVVIPSTIEEVISKTAPEEVVKELSEQKASDVASHQKEGIIIGADTVVAVDGSILGKPKNEEDAARMLLQIQGRQHQVFTGVTIIEKEMMPDGSEKETKKVFAVKTNVNVYPMTKQEIEEYIHTGEPMDKAGAYGIQGAFAAYIEGIEGDYTNVVGLPVGRVYKEIKNR